MKTQNKTLKQYLKQEVTLCNTCNCMTKTINISEEGKLRAMCGKCRHGKGLLK